MILYFEKKNYYTYALLLCIIHLNVALIYNPFNVLCFPWTFYNMTSGLLCYFVEHQRIRNFHYRNLHSKIKRNRSNNIITYIPCESRYKKSYILSQMDYTMHSLNHLLWDVKIYSNIQNFILLCIYQNGNCFYANFKWEKKILILHSRISYEKAMDYVSHSFDDCQLT